MNKLPFIEKAERSSSFRSPSRWNQKFTLFLFVLAVLTVFSAILIRLFQLTIVKGNYYRRLSEENRIKEIVIEAKRGTLLDRKGYVLAENQEADLKQNGERIRSKRSYFDPEIIASLVGYRQTADKSDFETDRCVTKLKLGDKIGKKGIEKVFDCVLRGRAGKKLVELDARGTQTRVLGVIPAEKGKTLQLALDLDLQKKAYEMLEGRKGAVVVTKPQTGEVLALVSTPTFNPQDFENQNQSAINRYLKHNDKPMFNRATEGVYPPGSVFKLFLASGALQDKKIKEDTTIEDTGEITAGPLKFGNWYFLEFGKTEGTLDIVKAIRRSNDIFFYRVGEKLGPERMRYWANLFGLGKKTKLPFEEAEGTLPSPFWKEEVLKDRWYLGDTYNLSIGQGYILVTPLQIAYSTTPFANNGLWCEPRLLKDELSKCKKLDLSSKTLELVREGMRQACSSGGTGWPLFDFKAGGKSIQTACKTGTAESHGKDAIPHAWITAFAPFDNPEIAVTVLVENGGQGSDVAGPIAKEVFKTYFERKN